MMFDAASMRMLTRAFRIGVGLHWTDQREREGNGLHDTISD